MISEFNRFFSSKSLASTYKPTFLKCLLDLGDYKSDEGDQWISEKEDSLIVDLNFVAVRFLRYYWSLRFKFKLKQEATTKPIAVYRILEEYEQQLGIKSTPSKKFLCLDKFAGLRLKTIRRLIKEGQTNIFIVYYNKYKNKNRDRFVYRKKKLNLKNLKRFCSDSDDARRFDADQLFPKYW